MTVQMHKYCGGPNSPMYVAARRSNWWFLLPILLSVIGGLIAYFVLRNDDPRLAKNCLYLGAALTVFGIGINYIMMT